MSLPRPQYSAKLHNERRSISHSSDCSVVPAEALSHSIVVCTAAGPIRAPVTNGHARNTEPGDHSLTARRCSSTYWLQMSVSLVGENLLLLDGPSSRPLVETTVGYCTSRFGEEVAAISKVRAAKT